MKQFSERDEITPFPQQQKNDLIDEKCGNFEYKELKRIATTITHTISFRQ